MQSKHGAVFVVGSLCLLLVLLVGLLQGGSLQAAAGVEQLQVDSVHDENAIKPKSVSRQMLNLTASNSEVRLEASTLAPVASSSQNVLPQGEVDIVSIARRVAVNNTISVTMYNGGNWAKMGLAWGEFWNSVGMTNQLHLWRSEQAARDAMKAGFTGVLLCCGVGVAAEQCPVADLPYHLSTADGCGRLHLYAVKRLLEAGFNVFFSDADVLYFQPLSNYLIDGGKLPLDRFSEGEKDLYISGHSCTNKVNIGLYFAKPSVLPLFETLLLANRKIWDQAAFDCILRGTCNRSQSETSVLTHMPHLKYEVLNPASFESWCKTRLRPRSQDVFSLHFTGANFKPSKIEHALEVLELRPAYNSSNPHRVIREGQVFKTVPREGPTT